jgi:hypothetical protein
MISLNKTVVKKYAYVKDGVIFNIKSSNTGDACVVEMNETTVPYITVDNVKQYFDGYIEDGDTYKAESEGGTKVFKKTVHSTTGAADRSITYPAYYRELCEKAIADSLITNYTLTYTDFTNNLSKLGVPTWILNQDPNETPVTGIEKIDFTQAYYNTSKEKRIKELAYESACNVVDKYGYKLTSPAKAEDLTIAKKEE